MSDTSEGLKELVRLLEVTPDELNIHSALTHFEWVYEVLHANAPPDYDLLPGVRVTW